MFVCTFHPCWILSYVTSLFKILFADGGSRLSRHIYYWIVDFINTNRTNSDTNYSNRNGNIQTYNIKILKTDAVTNIVSGGGGGGGGGERNYWGWQSGGGGAGGQSYIYNYLQTNDINYNIQVGSKG